MRGREAAGPSASSKMSAALLVGLCLLALALAAPRGSRWNPRGGGRIINGTLADIADFPWMLSLQYTGEHLCGASIISPRWALSAAHCVAGGDVAEMSIRAGTSVRESGGVVLGVSSSKVNSNFTSYTLDYDLSLLQVAEDFPLGPNIQIVELAAEAYDPPLGLSVTVCGWGVTETGERLPDLRQVELSVYPLNFCQDILPDDAPAVTERMVCVGRPNHSACHGDSGSPLVSGAVQVGVVSWGDPECGLIASLYSNVGGMRAWIRENAGI